ncbi:MAG: hypothetical protein ACYC4A_13850 [Desulfobulbia bacterium]
MAVPAYDGSAAATSVLMSAETRSNPILFVEGHCEVLLLTHHHPEFINRVVPCGGHLGVREAIRTIETWEKVKNQALRILGLLDRDYGSNSHYRRITVTNNRDLEIDLYLTEASVRLLREKASNAKCVEPRATISEAINTLRTVGLVRKYNSEYECGWSINDINLENCVDRDGVFDSDKFFSRLRQINSIDAAQFESLQQYITDQNGIRVTSIVRGHDVSILLGKWLRRKIGNRQGAETTMDVLEENLRLGSRWSEISRYHWGRRVQTHLTI